MISWQMLLAEQHHRQQAVEHCQQDLSKVKSCLSSLLTCQLQEHSCQDSEVDWAQVHTQCMMPFCERM